jgi:hypothetical protein
MPAFLLEGIYLKGPQTRRPQSSPRLALSPAPANDPPRTAAEYRRHGSTRKKTATEAVRREREENWDQPRPVQENGPFIYSSTLVRLDSGQQLPTAPTSLHQPHTRAETEICSFATLQPSRGSDPGEANDVYSKRRSALPLEVSCCRFDGHRVKLIPPCVRTQRG